MAFVTLRILDYAVYCPGILVLIDHQGSGRTQFLNYRVALEETQPQRILYLAVPISVYRSFFTLPFVQTIIKRFQIILIIYDPVSEVILEWRN